jgi:radical SAM superfamily enzyme YgiQ (UPF0313 family)
MYNVILFTDVTDKIVSSLSIGAFKCAHALRKNGYSCLVVGHLSEYTISELKELLSVAISDKTVLIGFSRTFFKSNETTSKEDITECMPISHSGMFPQGEKFEREIFEYINEIGKNIKVVAGGNKLSNKNISNKNVNYVCLGFSEAAIVNIVDHLINGTALSNSIKNIHGKIVIDGSLVPGYEFSKEDMVWEKTDVVNHKTLPLEIGRGCIFRCKFCSYPMNGKSNLDYIKSAENIYTELLDNYNKFGVTNYLIVDDTFNDHPDKLNLILSAINRLPFQPKFWAYIRLDLLCTRPETIDLLYAIGVRGFYFGIETLNLETGRIVGKGYDRKKQIETIQTIKHRYGDSVSLHGSFIVGLPKESLTHIQETFEQLLSSQIPLDSWAFNGLRITKIYDSNFSSEFDKNYKQYGYIDTGTPDNQADLNWKNEFMDSAKAIEIADEFNRISRTSATNFKLPAHTAFAMSTYGIDLSELMKSTQPTFDFHEIEHIIKPWFIYEYKTALLKMLKDNIRS